MIQFDWTISLGNMVSFGTLAFMAIWFLSSVKVRLKVLEEDLREIKDTVKEVSKHVIDSIITTGQVKDIKDCMNLLVRRVDSIYDQTETIKSRTLGS